MATSLSLNSTQFGASCAGCLWNNQSRNDGTRTWYCGQGCTSGIIPSGTSASTSQFYDVVRQLISLARLGPSHGIVVMSKQTGEVKWILSGPNPNPKQKGILLVKWVENLQETREDLSTHS